MKTNRERADHSNSEVRQANQIRQIKRREARKAQKDGGRR